MNNDELQNPIAVYFDACGGRREIRASELGDKKVLDRALELAHDNQLYHWSGSGHLGVNRGVPDQIRAHFVLKNGRAVPVYVRERSQEHDKVAQYLIMSLRSPPLPEGYWKWTNANGEVCHLRGYEWELEVIRTIAPGVCARHDIFGHVKTFYTSPFCPVIKIEVIDFHYPEAQVFDALMALTAIIPMVVMFTFVTDDDDPSQVFLKLDYEKGEICSQLFLQYGYVWTRDLSGVFKKVSDVKTARDLRLYIKQIRS